MTAHDKYQSIVDLLKPEGDDRLYVLLAQREVNRIKNDKSAVADERGKFIDSKLAQAEQLHKDGKVLEVISRLQRLRPKSPQLRESLNSLIRYYSENAGRMRYDEYLRLGYGIGSGAVESAHKQVVHARLRQAGMRWSEAGARRLLALRLLLPNDNWALLDRMRMVSLA